MRVLPKGALRRLRKTYDRIKPSPQPPAMESPPEPCAELVWQTVGTEKQIHYLTTDDVLDVHNALVLDFAKADDPIDPPGVRSDQLLGSAVYRQETSLGGTLKYPTAQMAGAALLHSIALNHAFNNGNKRTGIVSLLVFLDRNGLIATCDEQELFRFVLRVAQHGLVPTHCDQLADREVMEMARWINRHTRQIDKGERPIPWHRLKRILRGFDVDYGHAGSVGNRINLRRTIQETSFLGEARTRDLVTQVHYGDDGRIVERNAIHKIRRELELDEDHGIDSMIFYEAAAEPDDFIQQYRMLLRRLARL